MVIMDNFADCRKGLEEESRVNGKLVVYDHHIMLKQLDRVDRSFWSTRDQNNRGSGYEEVIWSEEEYWRSPPPSVLSFMTHRIPTEELAFTAAFESGNLFFVEKVDDKTFELELEFDPFITAQGSGGSSSSSSAGLPGSQQKPGTPFPPYNPPGFPKRAPECNDDEEEGEAGATTGAPTAQWFYFAVYGGHSCYGRCVKYEIVNISRPKSLNLMIGHQGGPLLWSSHHASWYGHRTKNVSFRKTDPERAKEALERQGFKLEKKRKEGAEGSSVGGAGGITASNGSAADPEASKLGSPMKKKKRRLSESKLAKVIQQATNEYGDGREEEGDDDADEIEENFMVTVPTPVETQSPSKTTAAAGSAASGSSGSSSTAKLGDSMGVINEGWNMNPPTHLLQSATTAPPQKNTTLKESDDGLYTLSFEYTFSYDNEVVFFAYALPYTCTTMRSFLKWCCAISQMENSKGVATTGPTIRRDCLCITTAGFPVDILYVTDKPTHSNDGMSSDRNSTDPSEDEIDPEDKESRDNGADSTAEPIDGAVESTFLSAAEQSVARTNGGTESTDEGTKEKCSSLAKVDETATGVTLTVSAAEKPASQTEGPVISMPVRPHKGPQVASVIPRFHPSMRKVIAVLARQHGGETTSSWVMQGFLRFLLGGSERARKLRSRYDWVILPMVAVDAVVAGWQRCSSSGVSDMNRYWTMTGIGTSGPEKEIGEPLIDPVIQAFRDRLLHIQKSGRQVASVIDLHSHTAKRDIFTMMTPSIWSNFGPLPTFNCNPDGTFNVHNGNSHITTVLSQAQPTGNSRIKNKDKEPNQSGTNTSNTNPGPGTFGGSAPSQAAAKQEKDKDAYKEEDEDEGRKERERMHSRRTDVKLSHLPEFLARITADIDLEKCSTNLGSSYNAMIAYTNARTSSATTIARSEQYRLAGNSSMFVIESMSPKRAALSGSNTATDVKEDSPPSKLWGKLSASVLGPKKEENAEFQYTPPTGGKKECCARLCLTRELFNCCFYTMEISSFGVSSTMARQEIHRKRSRPYLRAYGRSNFPTANSKFYGKGTPFCGVRLGSIGLALALSIFKILVSDKTSQKKTFAIVESERDIRPWTPRTEEEKRRDLCQPYQAQNKMKPNYIVSTPRQCRIGVGVHTSLEVIHLNREKQLQASVQTNAIGKGALESANANLLRAGRESLSAANSTKPDVATATGGLRLNLNAKSLADSAADNSERDMTPERRLGMALLAETSANNLALIQQTREESHALNLNPSSISFYDLWYGVCRDTMDFDSYIGNMSMEEDIFPEEESNDDCVYREALNRIDSPFMSLLKTHSLRNRRLLHKARENRPKNWSRLKPTTLSLAFSAKVSCGRFSASTSKCCAGMTLPFDTDDASAFKRDCPWLDVEGLLGFNGLAANQMTANSQISISNQAAGAQQLNTQAFKFGSTIFVGNQFHATSVKKLKSFAFGTSCDNTRENHNVWSISSVNENWEDLKRSSSSLMQNPREPTYNKNSEDEEEEDDEEGSFIPTTGGAAAFYNYDLDSGSSCGPSANDAYLSPTKNPNQNDALQSLHHLLNQQSVGGGKLLNNAAMTSNSNQNALLSTIENPVQFGEFGELDRDQLIRLQQVLDGILNVDLYSGISLMNGNSDSNSASPTKMTGNSGTSKVHKILCQLLANPSSVGKHLSKNLSATERNFLRTQSSTLQTRGLTVYPLAWTPKTAKHLPCNVKVRGNVRTFSSTLLPSSNMAARPSPRRQRKKKRPLVFQPHEPTPGTHSSSTSPTMKSTYARRNRNGTFQKGDMCVESDCSSDSNYCKKTAPIVAQALITKCENLTGELYTNVKLSIPKGAHPIKQSLLSQEVIRAVNEVNKQEATVKKLTGEGTGNTPNKNSNNNRPNTSLNTRHKASILQNNKLYHVKFGGRIKGCRFFEEFASSEADDEYEYDSDANLRRKMKRLVRTYVNLDSSDTEPSEENTSKLVQKFVTDGTRNMRVECDVSFDAASLKRNGKPVDRDSDDEPVAFQDGKTKSSSGTDTTSDNSRRKTTISMYPRNDITHPYTRQKVLNWLKWSISRPLYFNKISSPKRRKRRKRVSEAFQRLTAVRRAATQNNIAEKMQHNSSAPNFGVRQEFQNISGQHAAHGQPITAHNGHASQNPHYRDRVSDPLLTAGPATVNLANALPDDTTGVARRDGTAGRPGRDGLTGSILPSALPTGYLPGLINAKSVGEGGAIPFANSVNPGIGHKNRNFSKHSSSGQRDRGDGNITRGDQHNNRDCGSDLTPGMAGTWGKDRDGQVSPSKADLSRADLFLVKPNHEESNTGVRAHERRQQLAPIGKSVHSKRSLTVTQKSVQMAFNKDSPAKSTQDPPMTQSSLKSTQDTPMKSTQDSSMKSTQDSPGKSSHESPTKIRYRKEVTADLRNSLRESGSKTDINLKKKPDEATDGAQNSSKQKSISESASSSENAASKNSSVEKVSSRESESTSREANKDPEIKTPQLHSNITVETDHFGTHDLSLSLKISESKAISSPSKEARTDGSKSFERPQNLSATEIRSSEGQVLSSSGNAKSNAQSSSPPKAKTSGIVVGPPRGLAVKNMQVDVDNSNLLRSENSASELLSSKEGEEDERSPRRTGDRLSDGSSPTRNIAQRAISHHAGVLLPKHDTTERDALNRVWSKEMSKQNSSKQGGESFLPEHTETTARHNTETERDNIETNRNDVEANGNNIETKSTNSKTIRDTGNEGASFSESSAANFLETMNSRLNLKMDDYGIRKCHDESECSEDDKIDDMLKPRKNQMEQQQSHQIDPLAAQSSVWTATTSDEETDRHQHGGSLKQQSISFPIDRKERRSSLSKLQGNSPQTKLHLKNAKLSAGVQYSLPLTKAITEAPGSTEFVDSRQDTPGTGPGTASSIYGGSSMQVNRQHSSHNTSTRSRQGFDHGGRQGFDRQQHNSNRHGFDQQHNTSTMSIQGMGGDRSLERSFSPQVFVGNAKNGPTKKAKRKDKNAEKPREYVSHSGSRISM